MSAYNRDGINFASEKVLNTIYTSKTGIVQVSVEISLGSGNDRIIFRFPDSIILTEFNFNIKFAFNGSSRLLLAAEIRMTIFFFHFGEYDTL